MSNLEAVTKVADQILGRIFDQRQFTGGEIDYLVRELGERVDLTVNFDRLLRINENVCVINDTNRADMCSAHDTKRVAIHDQVTRLVDKAESMLRLATEYQNKDEQVLAERRRELERRQQECLRDCNLKLERLRESIVSEELELERKYLKFEENLRQTK